MHTDTHYSEQRPQCPHTDWKITDHYLFIGLCRGVGWDQSMAGSQLKLVLLLPNIICCFWSEVKNLSTTFPFSFLCPAHYLKQQLTTLKPPCLSAPTTCGFHSFGWRQIGLWSVKMLCKNSQRCYLRDQYSVDATPTICHLACKKVKKITTHLHVSL